MFILYEEVATKLNNNAYVSITRRMGKSDLCRLDYFLDLCLLYIKRALHELFYETIHFGINYILFTLCIVVCVFNTCAHIMSHMCK